MSFCCAFKELWRRPLQARLVPTAFIAHLHWFDSWYRVETIASVVRFLSLGALMGAQANETSKVGLINLTAKPQSASISAQSQPQAR